MGVLELTEMFQDRVSSEHVNGTSDYIKVEIFYLVLELSAFQEERSAIALVNTDDHSSTKDVSN